MKALWIDLPADAMNVAAAFRLAIDLPEAAGPATLHLAAADSYRLWINGRLAAHGPARTAHGYARVDEIPLPSQSGKCGPSGRAYIFVEVRSAHVPCFDGIDQNAFFAAEVVAADGRVLATTDDFEAWHDATLVRRVRRYSYQRGFVESYRLAADANVFRCGGPAPEGWTRAATVQRQLPHILPRGVPYPKLAFHDAGAPVWSGSVEPDLSATPPERREVSLVGNGWFKGYLPSEWEDDSALDAARLLGQLAIDAQEGKRAPNDDAPDATPNGALHQPAQTDEAEESGDLRRQAIPAQLFDFGRTITGFISLRVRAANPSGATILVAFDEVRAPDGAPFPVNPFRASWTRVLKWRLAPGDYDLLAFNPSSVRFAAVAIIDGAAEIGRFGIVDYENTDKARAILPPTGDTTLDAIVAAARETFAQSSVDLLTDCPSRERAGWLFDSLFTGRAESLFTGRNTVERAFLENYALAPKLAALPEGMIPMCYPAEALKGEYIANWSLWWLLELAQYRKRTGDEATVAASRPKIGPLLEYFESHTGPEGLLEDMPGWVFVEWSPCNDKDHVCGVNFPSNFLYAATLEAAASLLDRPNLAANGAEVRVKAARLAWNGEWFEDNAVRDATGALRLQGHITETGQYYAFYFGAATPETRPALWERLRAEFGPSRDVKRTFPEIPASNAIPGAYLRLELLLRNGRAAQCLDEIRNYFAPMARLTGTLWENLSPDASMDHGFASSAAWLIHQALRQLS